MKLSIKHKALLYLAGAFLYVIMPVDLAPDYFPLVGWLDDLLVAALSLRYAVKALRSQAAAGPRRGPRWAKPAERAPLDEEDRSGS